jgi:hypothetical protein
VNGRDHCLRSIVEQLGGTKAGREMGLHRVRSLEDFRETVPVRPRTEHAEEVESRVGFNAHDGASDLARVLAAGALEREVNVGVWMALLGGRPPQRTALLRAQHFDTPVDEILVDDLKALGGSVSRIDAWDAAPDVLSQLERIDPELLVVPSALTCLVLESVHRSPLERRLRTLRLILAEHDIRRSIRSRVPVRAAGWTHAAGRLGVATLRPPRNAITLAQGTTIIELLAYSNPEEDGRRVYADTTVLPEQAILGQRYEIVISSAQGFMRMRSGEHVKVVGFDMPSTVAPFPRARIVRLAPAPADVRLEGCTVAGAWLTASVRQALSREDPALVFAEIGPDPLSLPSGAAAMRTGSARLPDAFKDTELGWLAKTGAHRVVRKRPRGLLVRIEMQGYVGPELAPKLSDRIDANLRLRSPAYAHLRESDDLSPPRVLVARAGTRGRDEDRRVFALAGKVRFEDVRVVD